MDKAVIILVIVILLLNATIGFFATNYVVEYWGSMIAQKHVKLPTVPCIVASVFVGEVTVPAAIVTWIASFVIDNPNYKGEYIK